MSKKKVIDKLNDRKCIYLEQKDDDKIDKYTININDLYQIITDRRYNYVSNCREEPNTIILPELIYRLIKTYGATTYTNKNERFMGMKIIVRRDKKFIEQIEVFNNLIDDRWE